MTHEQAVYVLAALGIALEDATFTRSLEVAIGTIGVAKLHEAELAIAKERNLPLYRPEVRIIG